jgi:hypothetical protein
MLKIPVQFLKSFMHSYPKERLNGLFFLGFNLIDIMEFEFLRALFVTT